LLTMSDPRPSANVFEETTRMEAVAIAGIVMAAMIGLVMLKFLFNICINIVCLGEYEAVRGCMRNVSRIIPWWPRTEPAPSSNIRRESMIEIQSTLRGRALEDRKEIVATLLKDKVRVYGIQN